MERSHHSTQSTHKHVHYVFIPVHVLWHKYSIAGNYYRSFDFSSAMDLHVNNYEEKWTGQLEIPSILNY